MNMNPSIELTKLWELFGESEDLQEQLTAVDGILSHLLESGQADPQMTGVAAVAEPVCGKLRVLIGLLRLAEAYGSVRFACRHVGDPYPTDTDERVTRICNAANLLQKPCWSGATKDDDIPA